MDTDKPDLSPRIVLFDTVSHSEIRLSKKNAWVNGCLCSYNDFHGNPHKLRNTLFITAYTLLLIHNCVIYQCAESIPLIRYTKKHGCKYKLTNIN